MKIAVIIVAFLLLVLGCKQEHLESSAQKDNLGWQLVFCNDENGKPLHGDKSKLIKAVRSGYSVRVGWGGRRESDTTKSVEHVADAKFLTVSNGQEVFAQIDPILGQNPGLVKDTLDIVLHENLQWVILVGTNGFSDRMTTERFLDTISGHRARATEVSWFVDYPGKESVSKTSRPLW